MGKLSQPFACQTHMLTLFILILKIIIISKTMEKLAIKLLTYLLNCYVCPSVSLANDSTVDSFIVVKACVKPTTPFSLI